MRKLIYMAMIGLFSMLHFTGCDDTEDLLDRFISQGPIIYAAKVDSFFCQSGIYRVKVNVYPSYDVNRDYCMLRWNITSEVQDSVKLIYNEESYDPVLKCYSTVIDLSEDEIQGNLEIRAQNYDTSGNKSLLTTNGAYIYGSVYISTLSNDFIVVAADGQSLTIDRKMGSIGNYISYEQADGSFTEEEFVTENTLQLVNAKPGGIVKSNTLYHMKDNDIDDLRTTYYLETVIPAFE